MTAQDILNLRDKLNTLKSERSRKEGMLASIDERLETQFGAKTPEEGQDLLYDLESKGTQLRTKLQELAEEIQDKFGDKLNAIGR